MARAGWTYELPPPTGDSVWLEEYLVYDRDGEPAGKVFAVLEREGRRWLGVERDHLPLRHDRRAVPFDAVRELDHENLAVHLALDAAGIDVALELDPERGSVDGGDARRLVVPPPGETPPRRDTGAPGPVDRPRSVVAPLLLICGALSLMGAMALYGADPSTIRLVWFAVPAAFFVLAGVTGYRAWALPWQRSAAAPTYRPPRR